MKNKLENKLSKLKSDCLKSQMALLKIVEQEAALRDILRRMESEIQEIEAELNTEGIPQSKDIIEPVQSTMNPVTSISLDGRTTTRKIKDTITNDNPGKRIEIDRLYEILNGQLTKEQIDPVLER